MDVYFNHSFLIGSDATEVQSYLKEIASLARCVRNEGASLRFFEMFWQTEFGDGQSLHQSLYRLPNSDDLKLVMAYIDQGPHFKDSPLIPSLMIEPDAQANSYAQKLLHICYVNKCEGIVSGETEQVLSYANYSLSTSAYTMNIYNMIGENAVRSLLRKLNHFTEIEDVINDFEARGSKHLVIMDSAKKSAKRHNFLRRFFNVHTALIALETVELRNVLDGVEEYERIKRFRLETGLEISKESSETLNDDYCRRQREFIIPGTARKELFEWHVKIANHTRLHYFVDKQSGILYLGHCGKHLDTSNYNS